MSEDLQQGAAPTLPELEEAAHLAGRFHIRLHGFGQYDDAFDAEICARLARLIAHVRTPAPATTAGQQGEARPAPAEVERQAAELKKHVRRYATAYADYRAEAGFDGKEANFARLDALDADIDRLAALADGGAK